MRIFIRSSLFMILCLANHVWGQSMLQAQTYDLILTDHSYINGYEKTISGTSIDYPFPSSDIRSALLVRATTGKMNMEWETAPVPSTENGEMLQFIWLAGLGCNLGAKSFDLMIDDADLLTFQSFDEPDWSVMGKEGTRLSFETMMIDRHGDRFGKMILQIPRRLAQEGIPLLLKIRGHNDFSAAWVMTYQEPVKEKITLRPGMALLNEADGPVQPLHLSITYLGDPQDAAIEVDSLPAIPVRLEGWFNRFTINLPRVQTERSVEVRMIVIGQIVFRQTIPVKPVPGFIIYLVQHTHTDIGYTRSQTEILAEHLRYIDYVLDYCDQTDDYPEETQFRWTCEASWPVREYLQNRPAAQIERLKKRVKEGRIELTGMMFNMSEITGEASYVDFVQVLGQFQDEGLPVRTAMQNDVNGFAWCLVDYFRDTGVEYLSMGTHGHKALIAFEHPMLFWLESPAGNRLLAFRADHYMTGNMWGIPNTDLTALESEVFSYLHGLMEKGYPYDRIAVQYSGYMTDNSPPALAALSLIQEWNTKYLWPKLRSAVASEFLDEMKSRHASDFPVYRAAWPDWWSDGFGSAARETAAARKTQAEMIANMGLFSMAQLAGAQLPRSIDQQIRAVQEALLFFDEHTFGAAESISEPMSVNSQVQWMQKAAYVWEAVKNSRLLTEFALGLLQPYLIRSVNPSITVFNTLNWKRSGLVEVYIDNEILPADGSFRIVDERNQDIPAHLLNSRSDGNYWAFWVNDIPAFGYKTLHIKMSADPQQTESALSASSPVLENQYYRLVLNPQKGAISSLYDKELQQELIDPDSEWQFGQLIYEKTFTRGQLDLFTLETVERKGWHTISMGTVTRNPIWKSITVRGQSEGFDQAEGILLEIRLFEQEKRLELHYSACKESVYDPEGVYVAFPFLMPDAVMHYEVQGGSVQPGRDQIPGSSSDWNTFQNYIRLHNDRGQIVWGSSEMPLVHLGDINLGRFQYIAHVEKPHIYSWPMNNIWVTNFKASQEGCMTWSYYLTSSPDSAASSATRFGWSARVPLLARVLPAGKNENKPASRSFMSLDQPNILLVTARPLPDENAILLHLRETQGQVTEIPIKKVFALSAIKSVQQVNVLGRSAQPVADKIAFRPYEVKFIRVNY